MSSRSAPGSRLLCAGCGRRVDASEAYPFRCPAAGSGDGVDHVLRRELDPAAVTPAAAAIFADPEPDPFLRYRPLLHSYLVGRWRGLSDAAYVEVVGELQGAVAATTGQTFRATPCGGWPALAESLGAAELWVKDETGNVAGTHKGRHLMGVMIWLRVMERLDHQRAAGSALLAAASCGNAALAASVLAEAAGRRLAVFVPEFANAEVKGKLRAHGAELVVCPRGAEPAAQPGGDPCFLRLREELGRGALPFTCQGSENGLVADGGATLIWEVLSAQAAAGRKVDRLVVQVGGGALASACVQGLAEARQLGVLDRLPRLHAVQTEAACPLWRAWRRVGGLLLPEMAADDELVEPGTAAGWAESILQLGEAQIRGALAAAAADRGRFMWPWDRPGASAAYSILDDETYDWLMVVEGMLTSGGFPIVIPEATVVRAHRLAREATGINVDPTGTAGYAGCLALAEAGIDLAGETVTVLFTGVERATAGGSAAAAGPV